MKKLITILSMLPLLIMAQAPQGFTYQGVATDNNGFELQNQTISIQASILSSSATGTVVWQETHTTTTDTFGLFNVTIGEGISTNNGSSATFQEIDWGAASHFMKVEIDVNGGSNYVHVGTSQMMSVPYALYAENVHNLNMDSILGAVYDSINTSFASGAMSVSTFGDTLTLNGQSIIVPGLSYTNVAPTYGSVTDASGNTYQTLQFGTQEWMAENLITEHFANGDPIPMITNNYSSSNYSAAWKWYANNYTNEAIYGKMYNGSAKIDPRNVCPSGWHIPSENEWIQLILYFNYLGGQTGSSGCNTCDGGDIFKTNINWNGSNESYMSIVPSGHNTGAFTSDYYLGTNGRYWNSDVIGGAGGNGMLFEGNDNISETSEMNYYFLSVRCVKD